ncbi:restriction endonuclease subunit S [Vibrio cyclitrophicus]
MVADTKYPPSVKAGKPILGETPTSWTRTSLKNHLNLEQRKVKVEDNKEYDLVTVKRSRGGVVRREHLLGKQISVKSQFRLKEGDFLISKRQIVHGACGIVPAHLDGSIVSNEYSIFTAKDSFDLIYLRYLSETLYFQQTCFHSSIGVHIEKMIFKLDNWFKWDFNLPPLLEQRKIVKILSTWDKTIATTEKLIETSKQQKKSLMQQLLTGKKRLVNPEMSKVFEGDWEDSSIATTSKCFSGGTPSRTKGEYYGGNIPWITSGKLNDRFVESVNEYITESGVSNSSTKYVKQGALLVAMYGATAGKVAINRLQSATINQAVLALEVKEMYSNTFLFYLLEKEMEKALSLVQGGQPNLNAAIIKGLKIKLPCLKEQQKIASVLTAADKEIEVLEAKLAHFKKEKRALMQQLLTGKRRVKVDEMEIV